MIEAIDVLQASVKPGGLNQSLKPSVQEVQSFKDLMNVAPTNPVNQSMKTFVEKAQEQFDKDSLSIDKKLRQFDTKDSVFDLVDAMHDSSMKSISVQLTGKIGSKVSESFESLIKQQ